MKNKVKKPKIQWFENSYNLDECFPPVRVQITWATTVSAFQKLKMYVKVYFQLNVEYMFLICTIEEVYDIPEIFG